MQQLEGWRESWYIFAAYALVVAVLFFFIFHEKPGDMDDNTTDLRRAEADVKLEAE